MTFRSLYRLERRGLLDCPIVGVAVDDWTIDQLRRARARVDRRHRRDSSTRRCSTRFAARLSYVAGRLRRRRDLRARRARRSRGAKRPSSTSRSRRSCSARVVKGLAEAGLTQERARRRREAVRPRPRLGARARRRAAPVHRRVAALPDRPLPREDGPRGDPLPALREHDARAGLEPQLHRVRPDHDGRGLRRRGPRPLLRPGRRAARRRRQPPDAGGRRGRDGAAGAAATRRRSRTRSVALFRAIADGRPGALRARPVRRLPRRSTASRPDSTTETYAALRLEIENWRWAGVPFFIRTGKRLPVTQTELRLVFKRPPRLGFRGAIAHAGAEPARRQARPVDRRPARSSTRTGPTPAGPEPIDARHGVRRRGRRGPDAVRGAAARGDGRRQRRASPGRTASRRRGGSCSRCSTRPPPVHPYAPGSWGPEEADDAGRRLRPLARAVDRS